MKTYFFLAIGFTMLFTSCMSNKKTTNTDNQNMEAEKTLMMDSTAMVGDSAYIVVDSAAVTEMQPKN